MRAFTASLAPLSASLTAALVGFGGTVALIVQMGEAAGASPLQVRSAVTALCLGIALAGAGLSAALRMPVVLAWSTSGAALVAASASGVGIGYGSVVGAFVVAALAMVAVGLVPALGRLAERIPPGVAAALLAGVLLPFCLRLFVTLETDPLFGTLLLATFLLVRSYRPTYALLAVLGVAAVLVAVRGDAAVTAPYFGTLVATAPDFSLQTALSLGLPLFIVTLASQNLPGFAVLRAAGYRPPPRPVLLVTGLTTLVLAPFGAHGVNLAAITAALCTGPEAHPDPARRWYVGMVYAGFYLLLALFSAPLVGLFMTLPPETVAALTGIALLGPLGGALTGMLGEALNAPGDREAALLTFVTTASGVVLLGVGSALWGLVAGFVALGIGRLGKRLGRPRGA